jgi:hypothetical protein
MMMKKTAEQLLTNDWIYLPVVGQWQRVVQAPKQETAHRHGSGLLTLVTQADGGYPVVSSVSADHEYEVRQ